MPETHRGRGRPRSANVSALRMRALDILIDRGYDAVTMSEIAADAGMSVRTLHRYFPTKADIVWGGLDGALDTLRSALETTDERLSIIGAVTEAMVSVFHEEAEEATFGRARLRVIALTPGLEITHPDVYRRWREETVAFVARRSGADPADVRPQAAGAAIQTTIMEALAWWAMRNDDVAAADVVAEALSGLAHLADPVRRSSEIPY